MKILMTFIAALAFYGTAFAQTEPPAEAPPNWNAAQAAQLKAMIDNLASEGLENCTISDAVSTGNNAQNTLAAKQLAEAYLEGCTRGLSRARWHIESRDNLIDNDKLIRLALSRNELGPLFNAYKPQNPNYAALQKALHTETDPEKRRILALNMERWRWMPLYLGDKYLIVNAASFEVTLWQNHQRIKKWPVIVGKTKSPTPIFNTKVGGVIFNPWWEIPSSIVAEGIGSMVRNRPAEARRRGYVLQNGRYRQRPGPGNALGRMKLIMPNPYAVYLHDTSNRKLFANPVRTYSHGCIRVGDAIDFAKTLVARNASSGMVDKILEKGETQAVRITTEIPIYIAYFTAEAGGDNPDSGVVYYPDVYDRDALKLSEILLEREQCYS